MRTFQTIIKVIFCSHCLLWGLSCNTPEVPVQLPEVFILKQESKKDSSTSQKIFNKYEFLSAGAKIEAMKEDSINTNLEDVKLPFGLKLGMHRNTFEEIIESLLEEGVITNMTLSPQEKKAKIGTREYKFNLRKVSSIWGRMHADFISDSTLARLRMDFVLEDSDCAALFKEISSNESQVILESNLERHKSELRKYFFLKYDSPTVIDMDRDRNHAWFFGRQVITLQLPTSKEMIFFYQEYGVIPLAYVWYEDLKQMDVWEKEQKIEMVKDLNI